MDFLEIANRRQSCRSYDETRAVEPEKLEKVLQAARLAPSACNGQPYLLTVCTGQKAKEVALLTRGMGGMNKFAVQAPVCIVVSEDAYVRTAALGARATGTDYRSIDMGIMVAYLTAEAEAQGLSTCILGWLKDEKIRAAIGTNSATRLVITLGYAAEGDKLRSKKRKEIGEFVRFLG
jgi:nitroreductase